MIVAADLISQVFALFIMALALGMDAFSVCMGMGMSALRLHQAAKIGMWIGLFHMLMPLSGIVLGHLLSHRFGEIAGLAGGLLLVLIGTQMILSLARQDYEKKDLAYASDTGVMLFSLSVSIDSFSVGLGMGLFGTRVLAAILIFGLISMLMAWAGFYIGHRTQRYFGRYGEVLGGIIMLFFGLKLIFHIPL
ncbi:manganese efflux pump MntP family protein [Sporolactobacillus shoreae]|uniref:manganese efflux pump MntP n=1 Tax=Sporolactobacillus shoreae TaxID=1465501 RepID=UPI001583BAC5|nr:manganese efflux pump [Sporolactobacillus shoreae]